MADQPLFSVVMPLYNKRDWVRRSLLTALGQTLPAAEIIVVDDSSTDGSVAAIADLVGDTVRLVRQPNAGPGAARNRGWADATGEWIAFLDADDLWIPGHLAALARVIAATPGCGLVSTSSREIAADDADAALLEPVADGAIRAIDFLSEGSTAKVHTSSIAVRRDVLAAVGGFRDFCPGEDEELWGRLALRHRFGVGDAQTSIYLRQTAGVMEQEQERSREPMAPGTSPVELTMATALADPALAGRHAAVRRYLDRLHARDARICLYRGYPELARRRLRAMTRRGGREWGYWMLSLVPGPVLAPLIGARARWRRPLER